MPQELNDILFDRVVAHQVGVLRTADRAVEKVVRRFGECTLDEMRSVARYSNDGEVRGSRAEAMVRGILRVDEEAFTEIGEFLRGELNDLAEYEVEFCERLLETHLPFSYRSKRPSRAETRSITTEEPMAGGLLMEWVEGIKQAHFGRVRAQVRIAASRGETILDVSRRVRGTRPLRYRNGVSSTTVRSLSGMVKTAYNHVGNKARVDFFRAQAKKKDRLVTGYMWSAILDDDVCNQCMALDGEVFAPEDFDFVPPAHINCRCVAMPIIGEWDDYEFAPPRKITYTEWLRAQPISFQDEVLGEERAKMFRRGMSLKKFTDASGRRYDLSELRKIEARTMAKRSKTATRRDAKVLKNYGWRPDLPDNRDRLFAIEKPKAVAIPVRVSLRKEMPPIWDQGELGSCVAQACVAAHMFVHRSDDLMSRLQLYWSARFLEGMVDEDSGVTIRNGVKALAKFGVCREETWPYVIRKFRQDPPEDADQEALLHRAGEYHRLRSGDDFTRCLAEGRPFVFGFSVYDNIYDPKVERTGILGSPPSGSYMLGGHAVLAIGYDQDFHSNPVFKKSGLSEEQVPKFMYECRNSWGPRWGDAGNFWMDARMLEDRDVSDDFWTIFS